MTSVGSSLGQLRVLLLADPRHLWQGVDTATFPCIARTTNSLTGDDDAVSIGALPASLTQRISHITPTRLTPSVHTSLVMYSLPQRHPGKSLW